MNMENEKKTYVWKRLSELTTGNYIIKDLYKSTSKFHENGQLIMVLTDDVHVNLPQHLLNRIEIVELASEFKDKRVDLAEVEVYEYQTKFPDNPLAKSIRLKKKF